MDITISNIEELQEKYRLRAVSHRILWELKHVLQDQSPRPSLLQWFETLVPLIFGIDFWF